MMVNVTEICEQSTTKKKNGTSKRKNNYRDWIVDN
jgi:hypothetical protein